MLPLVFSTLLLLQLSSTTLVAAVNDDAHMIRLAGGENQRFTPLSERRFQDQMTPLAAPQLHERRDLQEVCSYKEQFPDSTLECYDEKNFTVCPNLCNTDVGVVFTCQSDASIYQYDCQFMNTDACTGKCNFEAPCDSCEETQVDTMTACNESLSTFRQIYVAERANCTSCSDTGSSHDFTCNFGCPWCDDKTQCATNIITESYKITNDISRVVETTILNGTDKGTVFRLEESYTMTNVTCRHWINDTECTSCALETCDIGMNLPSADCSNVAADAIFSNCGNIFTGVFASTAYLYSPEPPLVLCPADDDTTTVTDDNNNNNNNAAHGGGGDGNNQVDSTNGHSNGETETGENPNGGGDKPTTDQGPPTTNGGSDTTTNGGSDTTTNGGSDATNGGSDTTTNGGSDTTTNGGSDTTTNGGNSVPESPTTNGGTGAGTATNATAGTPSNGQKTGAAAGSMAAVRWSSGFFINMVTMLTTTSVLWLLA